MSPPELVPTKMARVALVSPRDALRDVLAATADRAMVDLDAADGAGADDRDLDDVVRRLGRHDVSEPRLAAHAPLLDELERNGEWELLAGELELRARLRARVDHGPVSALLGWTPHDDVGLLRERVEPLGAAVVVLPHPRGEEPPTLLPSTSPASLRPLVETYGTVRYGDVDPTTFAGVSYVFMFGMMFGDVGHGLVLALLGLFLRTRRGQRWRRIRTVWPLVVAAGLTSAAFGLAYGEAFGPTGLVRALWLSPMEEPVRLLVAAGFVGATLIAISYVLGSVNRWRESGPAAALVAASGLAGATVYVGLGLMVVALWVGPGALVWVAVGILALGAAMLLIGLVGAAEPGGGRFAQAFVELFDALVRIATNAISFTRLAAFGLTHAAIGEVVWSGASGAWSAGPGGVLVATVLFLVGNAVAFSLEALVVAVQALRLEYYELFSRIFLGEGRPFEPWHVPVQETTS